jgi:hypothetical protein
MLMVVLALVLGSVGYQMMFAADEGFEITVLSQDGEVFHIGADGEAAPAVFGTKVGVQDSVRTGADGSVVLGMGVESQIRLAALSSIRVLSADMTGIRVELEEGRVSARVRPGSPSLGISSRGRAANAVDADFTVAVDAEGALAIEPERGEVLLQGVDGVERLTPGSRTTDLPGRQAVTAPVPSALLLEVAWPENAITREREVTIRGRTGPYVSVQIDGAALRARVRAGPDGRFRAKVPIREGRNTVEVRATDAMGESTVETHSVTRDSTAPAVETEVQWGR